MKRWLQVHLLTAIVLMFTAGGLIWLNVKPAYEDRVSWFCDPFTFKPGFGKFDSENFTMSELQVFHFRQGNFGWPFILKIQGDFAVDESINNPITPVEFDDLRRVCDSPIESKFLSGESMSGEMRLDDFSRRAPELTRRIVHLPNVECRITNGGLWNEIGALYNSILALGILAIVAFACEWYVRRR